MMGPGVSGANSINNNNVNKSSVEYGSPESNQNQFNNNSTEKKVGSGLGGGIGGLSEIPMMDFG